MATRRENGMGSMLRRKQRNTSSSPYKRRQPAPANNKLQSSSSLSSFLSFISGAFRRKSTERVEVESEQSEDGDTTGTDLDEPPESDPELGHRNGRRIEKDNGAADSLSRLGQSLQQSITQPKVLPPSSILPPDRSEMKSSATTSHIAPPSRPRRSVQPAFATSPRASTKRPTRPSFPGGIGSYGGFSATAEPSPPPFTSNNPLENSFAANRPPSSKFTFTAKLPSESKTSSEVLAEFFAAKGKAPLTAAERREVARLIAESDAESSKSQSPDADPYNGVPSFSFLKATFPAPERDSTSPSSSIPVSESATSVGSSVAPRKRRPINYGGASKRSAAITKAGFTLREHQKLLEKQKSKQENVAPDASNVGDKRSVRDTDEDGGGKRRRNNDGQSAAVEETPAKGGVGKVLSLSAQPSMPSPLRQMTKLNSPSPPRVALRAQAPSPASPLSRVTPNEAATPKAAPTTSPAKPASTQTPAKPKPRKSLVADVMRDMLAEDKAREKQEKPVDTTVFLNPYEEAGVLPAVTAPKVRKPRRTSARPAAKTSATAAKQETKPMSLIEKIEQTDVRPNPKKAKTEDAAPPSLTFTAPSPKDVTPKARRPPPVVEEPVEPVEPAESTEVEVIDLDEELKHKSSGATSNRPALSVDVVNNSNGSKSNTMLGLPHRQRPSFSLHSPARPSPLREMSVPIEDEEDEILEICGPTAPASNGFPPSSSVPFSNGFSSITPSSVFSAPVPPPAPTLAPAQLPNKTQTPKIDAPLFGSSKPVTKSDAPSFFAAPKPAEPKPAEPKPDVPSFFAAPKPVEPKAEVPSFFKVSKPAEPKPAPVVEPKSVVPEPKSAPKPLSETELKASASSVPVSALPVFTFTTPIASSTPKTSEARAAADLPISKLPTFTFGAPAAKTPSFNWGAAGFKAPVAASGSTWTCGTCMLSNPASATEKCTVCDAKKPGAAVVSTPAPAAAPAAPAPAAKTASFDWGAAGMKAPTTPSTGSWTCATCSLSNPATATEKCTVCDAAKPGAAPITKTASFNWGAAGMKAPSTSTAGQWTCSTCSLSNPATATEKCTVCDAKKPGAAPPVKTASFDWGAAGLKAPTTAGGWTCSTCGLSNKDGAATKCSICDAAR
ncbi:unnamed protein product [Rhizoctonia solani]|uniref:RanBP2-type domain-containing protein n=1 Tax=Rhizoctonia solani TaxID=456999 RepID=A0A8H2XWR4_9AGAM|nr:unnamed protein product [Rhizoctonia solani]